MTEETAGCAARPATATSRRDRSLFSAYVESASMRSQSASCSQLEREGTSAAREPEGASPPRVYLPVSRPYSSGKYGRMPRPKCSEAGTTSSSTVRSSSE